MLMSVRYLLLLLSMFGYGLLIYKRFDVKAEFIPAIVFSSITAIMYAAGLLNVMYSATWLLLLAGFFIFLYLILSKNIQLSDYKNIFTPGIIIFLLSSAAVFLLYRGARLYHYDNFSHWGLIVKLMLLKNRLPNFSDAIISYKTYPPGSALFIYYITRIIGKTEGKMLIAQNILLLSCVLTLFSFIENKKRVISYIMLSVSSLFLIILPLSLDFLLVDTLLPFLALANTAAIIYYRKDIIKAGILSLPLLVITILVKDSGILFAVINSALLALLAIADCCKKYKSSNKDKILKVLAVIFIVVIIPIACRYLWTQHIEMVFPANTKNTSRHALSLDFFRKTLSYKSGDDRNAITRTFIEKVSSLENQGNQLMIAFNLLLMLVMIFNLIFRKKIAHVIITMLAGNVLYAVYQVCLFFTYLVSMPVNEARYLAGYDRYNASIMCYILGLSILCIAANMFDDISLNKNKVFNAITGTVAAAAFLFGINHYKLWSRITPAKLSFDNSVVLRYDKAIEGLKDLSSKSYLIYVSPKEYNNYIKYMSRYKLFTDKFEIIQTIESDEFFEKVSKYEYLLVLDNERDIVEILEPVQKRDSYIGHYDTDLLKASFVGENSGEM